MDREGRTMKRAGWVTVACIGGLSMLGCQGKAGPPDAGFFQSYDAGPQIDAGPVDAGPDPCVASADDAVSTVGCNGGLYGTRRMTDAIDGPCDPTGDGSAGAGSCTVAAGSMPVCVPDATDPTMGTCSALCPVADTHVSKGGCPAGSRCIKGSGDVSICLRDCHMDTDCFEGETCNAEGSCVQPAADGGMPGDGGPPGDGGMPGDAAVPGDGGTPADAGVPGDGGTPDGGAVDGGAVVDGGAATDGGAADAGTTPFDAGAAGSGA